MNYYTLDGSDIGSNRKVAFLVSSFDQTAIRGEYLLPYGIPVEDVLIVELYKPAKGEKLPVSTRREYFNQEVGLKLNEYGVEIAIVCDNDYFKAFTGLTKAEPLLGAECSFKNTAFKQKVFYCLNYRSIFYSPIKARNKISIALSAVSNLLLGKVNNSEVIKKYYYPKYYSEIKDAINFLGTIKEPLAIDIETYALRHTEAGIGTIAFSWNQEDGIAFKVDIGRGVPNHKIRYLLKQLFHKRKHIKDRYHNASFDTTVLTYCLFMDHSLDTEGLLNGLDVLLTEFDCTKIIKYLATNSADGNELSLKSSAQSFAGNWALDDIKDISKTTLSVLLPYNLTDTLATNMVYDTYYPKMVEDDQLDIYESIFKPAVVDVVQMQLTGMPVDKKKVKEVEILLHEMKNEHLQIMNKSPYVLAYTFEILQNDPKYVLNYNSPSQIRAILYDQLELPIIEYTKTGLPAAGSKVAEKLLNHTDEPLKQAFLKSYVEYKKIDKLITSFIPSLLNAYDAEDGWSYLFGFFSLGGTVSGRLSSNSPNLQQLPSSGKLAKLIKSCFAAPKGWLFCGIDAASLEDRISALTTKDRNKIKVYEQGFDGHCLRAYSYFKEQMPDIDGDSVTSINSIEYKYPDLRQKSKAPTFALTYLGTQRTLEANCGFSAELADQVYKRFHELYSDSTTWVQDKLKQAVKDGYVTGAFGLRLRTPVLAQTILGSKYTPKEAEAEGRTAGNMLGQSWCLLNSRAGTAVLKEVRNSKYRLDIKPCAQIHDAQYYLIRATPEVLHYTNLLTVKEMSWQDHPDIWHENVHLGGDLSVFYPDWNHDISLKNGLSLTEVESIFTSNNLPIYKD